MPDAMGVRRQTVEHPFGTIKAWMGSPHFSTRTLTRVSTEMSLHVLAYNIKRVIAIIGVGPLLQAAGDPGLSAWISLQTCRNLIAEVGQSSNANAFFHGLGAERVLDGLPAHAHSIWHPIEPGLHRVEDPFVFPALDPL